MSSRKPIPRLSLLNLTDGLVHDAECLRIHGAITTQANHHLADLWGIECSLLYVRPGTRTPADPKTWWLVLAKDQEQVDSLGLKDLTPAGCPMAIVLAKDVLESGGSVSLALSRALLELLVDPTHTLFACDPETKIVHPLSITGPCGDDAAYIVNGLKVSDFVLPAYYQPGNPGPFDYRRTIKKPFEILPGGTADASDKRVKAGECALEKSTSSITAPAAPQRAPLPAPDRAGPPVVRPGVPAPPAPTPIRPPLRAQHPDGAPPLAIDHKAPPAPLRTKTKDVIVPIPTLAIRHPAPLRCNTRSVVEVPGDAPSGVVSSSGVPLPAGFVPTPMPSVVEEPRKAFPAPARAGVPGKVQALAVVVPASGDGLHPSTPSSPVAPPVTESTTAPEAPKPQA